MNATIRPGLVAPMTGMAHDLGCRRVSFLAQKDRLTVLAATPDKSALLHGFVPATVFVAGGFSLDERNMNLMRSPSMARAQITYNKDGIACLSYSGRSPSSEASPFMGKRHPAIRLPAEFDARATAQTQELIDSVWKSSDEGYVDFKVAGGQMSVNGTAVGEARGEAAGRYFWRPVACMLDGCQHARSLAVQITDGGPLLLTCTEEIDLRVCVAHA